jgi:AcrR family transcriptional regulator
VDDEWHGQAVYDAAVTKNGPDRRRAGRRSGQPDTRATILEAARAHFTKSGYAATVRAIAEDAGVDAAMINYFFGSKKQLFGEAFALPENPAASITGGLEGPIAELPRRLLGDLLDTWDNPERQPALLALMMLDIAHVNKVGGLGPETDGPADTGRRGDFAEDLMITPVADRLRQEGIAPAEANRRSALLATQLMGVLFARYVLRVGPVAEMPAHALLDGLLPALDVIVDPTSQ